MHRRSSSSATRLPPIGLDPSTPHGLAKAIAIGAGECLMAAQYLDEHCPSTTGEYILTFHAIELGLKAFLTRSGVIERDLAKKPYGHNLTNLYDECKRRGMIINIPRIDGTLAWINEWHNDGVKIRYKFDDERYLPMCVTLFPLATAIISLTGMHPNS
jgi:hypothetical protein